MTEWGRSSEEGRVSDAIKMSAHGWSTGGNGVGGLGEARLSLLRGVGF